MLAQERLKELLDYNPATGEFRWKRWRGGASKAGDIAGCLDRNGYRLIGVDGVVTSAGRLAWLYMTGSFPTHRLKQLDGVRSNNVWENLRMRDGR